MKFSGLTLTVVVVVIQFFFREITWPFFENVNKHLLFTSQSQISTCFSSIHFWESSIWANSTKANPRDAPTCVTDQHKGVLIPTFLAAAYVYGTPRGCPGVLRHPRGIPGGVSRELIVGQEQGPLQFAIVRMRS